MRHIKFRGQTIGGEWVTGNLSILEKDFSSTVKKGYYISNSAGAPFAFMVRPESVGQFTGLHDKNGMEIYEGDFLSNGTSDRVLVIWRQDLASFALSKNGWMYDHYFGEAVDPGYCEVIGNIHTQDGGQEG